jgi:hypothetical protein
MIGGMRMIFLLLEMHWLKISESENARYRLKRTKIRIK